MSRDREFSARGSRGPQGLRTWAVLLALAGSVAHGSASARSSATGEGAVPSSAVRQFGVAERPSGPFDVGPVLQARRLRGLRPQIARQILTAPEGGQLPVEALAVPVRRDVAKPQVALFVEIDGAGLLEHNQVDVARLEIYVYALGPGARIAGYLAEVFAVDVRQLGERLWQGGLKLYGGLELPAGSYELRILVRNDDSGASGLDRVRVEVPPSDPGSSYTLPPIFESSRSRDAWLPVLASRSGEVDFLEEYPLLIGDRAISPEARPVLVAGREVSCHLLAYGLPAGTHRGTLEFLQEGSESRVQGSIRFEAAAPVWAGPDGLEVRRLRFTPPELPPGPYGARVRWESDGASAGSSAAAPVLVVSSATRERDLLWSDLRWMIRGRRPTGSADPSALTASRPPAPARKERDGRAARRLAGRYREVLTLLHDSPEAARAALFELESEALRDGEPATLRRLLGAQLEVAEGIAEHQIEALVPVLVLHGEMVRLYRGRRLYLLVSHSRAMVELLAERFAELGGSPRVTAGVLSSEAGYLQEANLPASSRRLFWRALEHEPDTPAALLGLAVSFEKYGHYSQAVEVLERLVEAAPELDEGWLRLAVNLARIGRLAQAREILLEVADRGAGDWVCALAYQELARGHLISGDVETAAELLERAVGRMIDWPGLRLLLAHVYDRLGRSQDSLEQLLAIRPQTSGQRVAARLIYDQWPRTVLDAERRRLRDAAARKNEELARAVAGDSRENGGKGG